jgi:hypothetical protein
VVRILGLQRKTLPGKCLGQILRAVIADGLGTDTTVLVDCNNRLLGL